MDFFSNWVNLVLNLKHFEKKIKVSWFGPEFNALLKDCQST